MIRRDITFDDGTAGWLLISQVEHARISGALTQAWHEPFSAEAIEGITHHDDGWVKWESTPQLDAQRGRPYSFTELPIDTVLAIWDGSIAAARRIGPLAGAIVAGHFIGLASGSDQAVQPCAEEWLHATAHERGEWLDEWQGSNPSHTRESANRAQQMLLTADLLSLWLCLDGPIAGDDAAVVPNAEMESRTSTILGKYRFTTQAMSVDEAGIDWRGSLAPWPFAAQELDLEAPALAVPAAKYDSWAEIAVAGRPRRLRWQLRETLSTASEC